MCYQVTWTPQERIPLIPSANNQRILAQNVDAFDRYTRISISATGKEAACWQGYGGGMTMFSEYMEVEDEWRDLYLERPQLEVLKSSWASLLSSALRGAAEPQFNAILGYPGMGCTRLVHRYFEWLAEQERIASGNEFWPEQIPRSGSTLFSSPLYYAVSKSHPMPFLWAGITLRERLSGSRNRACPEPLKTFLESLGYLLTLDEPQRNPCLSKPGFTVEQGFRAITRLMSERISEQKAVGRVLPLILFIENAEYIEEWPEFARWFYSLLRLAQEESWPLQIVLTHELETWNLFRATGQGVPGRLRDPSSIHSGWKYLQLSEGEQLPEGLFELSPPADPEKLLQVALPGVYRDPEQRRKMLGKYTAEGEKRHRGWVTGYFPQLCQLIALLLQPENSFLFVRGSNRETLVADWQQQLARSLDIGYPTGNVFRDLDSFIYSMIDKEDFPMLRWLVQNGIRLPRSALDQFLALSSGELLAEDEIRPRLAQGLFSWLNSGRLAEAEGFIRLRLSHRDQALLLRLLLDLEPDWPEPLAGKGRALVLARRCELQLEARLIRAARKTAQDYLHSLPSDWSFEDFPLESLMQVLLHAVADSSELRWADQELLPGMGQRLRDQGDQQEKSLRWAIWNFLQGRNLRLLSDHEEAGLGFMQQALSICNGFLKKEPTADLYLLLFHVYRELGRAHGNSLHIERRLKFVAAAIRCLESAVERFGRDTDRMLLFEMLNEMVMDFTNILRGQSPLSEAERDQIDSFCVLHSNKGVKLGFTLLRQGARGLWMIQALDEFHGFLVGYHLRREETHPAVQRARRRLELARLDSDLLLPGALIGLAKALLAAGNHQQALDSLQELFSMRRDTWLTWKRDYQKSELLSTFESISKLLEHFGRFSDMARFHREILGLLPEEDEALNELLVRYAGLRAWLLLREKQVADASRWIKQALHGADALLGERHLERAYLLALQGYANALQGNGRHAARDFRQALKLLIPVDDEEEDSILARLPRVQEQRIYMQGRVRQLHGAALAQEGKIKQARSVLRASIEELGSVVVPGNWYLEQARSLLNRLAQPTSG